MHRAWVAFVNVAVLLTSSAFLLFAYGRAGPARARTFADFGASRPYRPSRPAWPASGPNPAPARTPGASANATLYAVVLDLEHRPGAHHCLMKRQWIDPFLARREVEAVEVYSLVGWAQPACGLRALAVPRPPPDFVDPSAWRFVNALRLALNRSASGWLFVVGDAAYIRVAPFFEYFAATAAASRPLARNAMLGGCLEKRYFFQMLTPESGVFVSRRLAEELLSPAMMEVWAVVMKTGIRYDEALAHLTDQLGVHIKGAAAEQFLGRAWRNASHFALLESKAFGALGACAVPRHYVYNAPGELGVCSWRITRLNDVVAWSAAEDADMGKAAFLARAERMLAGNPDDLGYYWDRTRPMLCLVQPGERNDRPAFRF
jgi:hypothetical protein